MPDRAGLPGSGGSGDDDGTPWDEASINKLPGGRVARNFAAGPVDVTATATVVSETFTAMTSRLYEIDCDCIVSSTVAGDDARISITDGSNTPLLERDLFLTSTNPEPLKFSIDDAPSAGSTTYKIRGTRNSGTGTVNVSFCSLRITCVGPAF